MVVTSDSVRDLYFLSLARQYGVFTFQGSIKYCTLPVQGWVARTVVAERLLQWMRSSHLLQHFLEEKLLNRGRCLLTLQTILAVKTYKKIKRVAQLTVVTEICC